jgi:hypothetical protein
MFTDSLAETLDVVIGKVAVVLPERTVTDTGTWRSGLLEVSVTTVPPLGAGLLIATVPVLVAPPVTELGEADT